MLNNKYKIRKEQISETVVPNTSETIAKSTDSKGSRFSKKQIIEILIICSIIWTNAVFLTKRDAEK